MTSMSFYLMECPLFSCAVAAPELFYNPTEPLMQAWINHHPALFIGCLFVYLILFWLFVVNIVALASGWKLLAKRFRAQFPFSGAVWKWQSAMIRSTRYNGGLKIGADPMGLLLDVMPIFRVGHPSLFIPWTEITVRHEPWFPREIVEIKLGTGEQVRFRIRGTLASRLQQAAGASWTLDSNYPAGGPGRSGPENQTSSSTRFIVK